MVLDSICEGRRSRRWSPVVVEDEKKRVNLLSQLWHWSDGVNSDPSACRRRGLVTTVDRLGQIGTDWDRLGDVSKLEDSLSLSR